MKIKSIAKNQFLVYLNNKAYLQSYDSVVVEKGIGKNPILYRDWDYSRTTMKYVCKFLCDVFHAERIVKKDIIKLNKEGKITILDTSCEI